MMSNFHSSVEHHAGENPFQFLASPITTNAVDTSVLISLASSVAALSQGKDFENELKGIVLFPIVANQDVYVRADFVVNKRSDHAFYVGKNIDYETWLRAGAAKRLKLAAENFESSIMAIPDRHFSEEAKGRLISIVRAVSSPRRRSKPARSGRVD